jgi:hypothetical protein
LLHALVLDISLPLQFVPHDKPLSASSFHSFQGDFPMSSRDQQAAGLQRDFLHKPPVWQLVFTTKTTEIFCCLQDAHCKHHLYCFSLFSTKAFTRPFMPLQWDIEKTDGNQGNLENRATN